MKTLLLAMLMVSSMGFAQEPNIGLQSFEAVDKAEDYVEAEMLFQKVKELFVKSNRFRILDRESLGIVLDEQEIQKQITSINAEVVNQGQIAGAENIVGGKLISLDYKEVKGAGKVFTDLVFGKNGNETDEILYRPVLTFSLNIISTESSETIHSETFDVGTFNTKSLGGTTKQEAFKNALNSLEDQITRDFINKFLAEKIAVLGIEEEENGEAKMLLINTGNSSGAEKDDKFKVYHISVLSVNDREIKREKEIGEIQIVDVEGEELSTAKVIKGGPELLSNFHAGETLICKTE